ncbi:hypothetical protein EVAR_59455_1 [Eumeta japonica]|uniref:Uncharacterized protein n=1 Tax=Eumeta variegata TaxID=151549 RepID=A0A4C1ZXZ0_EUMVA|nr:hypothetical protein EVAR_59455_1 [Eumeta japonica]
MVELVEDALENVMQMKLVACRKGRLTEVAGGSQRALHFTSRVWENMRLYNNIYQFIGGFQSIKAHTTLANCGGAGNGRRHDDVCDTLSGADDLNCSPTHRPNGLNWLNSKTHWTIRPWPGWSPIPSHRATTCACARISALFIISSNRLFR